MVFRDCREHLAVDGTYFYQEGGARELRIDWKARLQ